MNHLLVEAQGLPLAESLTAANVHDTHGRFPVIDSVPAVKTPTGQRRFRPTKAHGDKTYASRKNRRGLRRRGICQSIWTRPVLNSGACRGTCDRVIAPTVEGSIPAGERRGRCPVSHRHV
ncbi:transposase [Myxococcus xanthus]|uniref:transposase n=1 Tax=Myxococcus xanthus TaxID=34 RepID=UPI00191740E3|nr:transposase [Myxococcus xanthus]